MQLTKHIERYKEFIQSEDYHEVYKWKVFKYFTNTWTNKLDGEGILQNLNDAFLNEGGNLWSGSHYLPLKMLKEFCSVDSSRVGKMFETIFDKNKPLEERLHFFESEADELVRLFSPDKELSTYQGKRAMSLYLSLKYPDKYYMFKSSMYKDFCKVTDFKPSPGRMKRKEYKKLVEYFSVCDEIREILVADPELLDIHNRVIPDEFKLEDDYHLLTQDFIYSVANLMVQSNENISSDQQCFLVGAYWKGHETEDQTNRFIENRIWENGYDDKFIEEIKSISVGSNIAIKSVFTRNKTKSVMAIKSRGVVLKNRGDGKFLDVKWEQGFTPFEVDFSGGYWATFKEVKKKEHIKAIWYSDYKTKTNTSMNYPLNTILYGPPGTGKTYNTILRAAQIIEDREIESYDEALKIFKSNLHDKIEFITFHQNYSYEDFIQGLRPDTEHKGQLSFDKKDGVFTRIATNALFEFYKKQKEDSTEGLKDESDVYLDFIDYLKNLPSKDFKSSTGSTISIASFTKNDNIEFKHGNSSKTYIVSANRLLKLFKKFPKISLISSLHSDIRDAIGGCNTTVYWVALKEFISFYDNYETPFEEGKDQVLDEIGYETKKKLLATIDKGLLRSIHPDDVPHYVIIIDEINRANISRVFGELITLIESDKRSRGDIPLEAMLPSGDPFIVPSNLHIIGTMNTADKSIALLDIALRRRFEFESMYPLYAIGNEDIYDAEILQKINNKIIDKKGHDFQIGHAYFMGDNKDLKERMNKKVIPLLLEYFMNDKKEVEDILKSAGLKIEEKSWPLKITGKND